MKFLFAAVAFLASASAFCPNLCNGHGKCGNQDRCTCYTYAGTTRGDNANFYEIANQRAAWTGADCSLRTCPLAFSWSGSTPNGLSSSTAAASKAGNVITITFTDIAAVAAANGAAASAAVTKEAQGTAAAAGSNNFARGQMIRVGVTLCTIQSTAANGADKVDVTTYETSASANGAVTVYFEPWEADAATTSYINLSKDFGQWDANGAHGLSECAGQGLCDRSTGQCNCFPGYEGEACTRTSCANGCSGHGICLEAKRIAADFGNTYAKPWDANKNFGCKCDVGFRGSDCSLQECPSDYDPLNGCGGGRCNANAASYTDRLGATVNCPNNAATIQTINNIVYSISTSDCTTNEQRDCSGRGICDYTSGVCKCFSGFFGESCNIQTVLV